MEIWKDILNYEGLYKVSNLGRVKSCDRKVIYKDGRLYSYKSKVLKQSLNTKGYKVVCLSKKGISKCNQVHQLIAIAFLNHNKCKMHKVVDHIDNDPFNNNLSNLQLLSNRENVSKTPKKTSSKYVGVFWSKNKKRWFSRICKNGKTKHIGSFKNEFDARLAYLSELKKIKL